MSEHSLSDLHRLLDQAILEAERPPPGAGSATWNGVLAIFREMRENLDLPAEKRPDLTVALVRSITDDRATERRLGPAVRKVLAAIDGRAPLT